MKRKLLYLAVLAIFSSGIAYSQYVEDTITVNKTLVPPEIDGYNDDEAWETEEFYTITEYGLDEFDEPQSPDPDDFIAQYKMLWDDEYQIAGLADILEVFDDRIYLIDIKTSHKIGDDKLGKYSIQLELYRRMIEKQFKRKAISAAILHFDDYVLKRSKTKLRVIEPMQLGDIADEILEKRRLEINDK